MNLTTPGRTQMNETNPVLGAPKGLSGLLFVAGFIVVRPGVRLVDLALQGSLGCALGWLGSSDVAGFTGLRPRGRRFHPVPLG